MTLDLKHPRGRALMRALIGEADLLVENFAPGTLARLGLEPSELLEAFPRLSIVSISNFGQDGAERGGLLNDLTLFARGGWTFPVGERDRAPLTPPGSLAQYVGGLYGAVGAMQAILARDLTAHRGQHVDISLLEATVATMIYETVAFQYNGILRERAGRRFAVGPFLIVTLECRDGYAGLQCVTDKQFEGLCNLMERPELRTDERFSSALKRMVNNDALLEIVAAFFLEHDRKWLYREGQARAIPIVPIPSVAEVLEWEQTRARDYFETIDDPALGPIRIPGAPLRLHSHRAEATRPAPRLGEHNREVSGRAPGSRRARAQVIGGRGRNRGGMMGTIFDKKIRVLDLSMGWAGPLAGQMLAEMGAEVIKVEDTHHFDWWRGSLSMGPPEMQPIERAATFNTANRGKLGVTLDLLNPRGIELVKRIVAHADILIENYSPGVMERLRADLRDSGADQSAADYDLDARFGYDGPETFSRGYGNTVEAMAGVTGLARYHDSEDNPTRYRTRSAIRSGDSPARSRILAAIYERENTGRGQWIELAQVEARDPVAGGPDPRVSSHRQGAGAARQPPSRSAPHGIFRCAGGEADAWIALAAHRDDQWRGLARALGIEHLASDPRFLAAASRKANEDALDAAIGAALAAISADDAVARLSAAGVYAAPVNSAPAVLGDSQLQERGYFVPIERAVVGTHLYPGAVARMSATPAAQEAPAPLLGEHNGAVFRGLLEMTDAEIAELEAAGVIGTAPRTYRKAS